MVLESCGANGKKHVWKVTIFIEELQEQFDCPKEKEKEISICCFLFFKEPDKKLHTDFTTVVLFLFPLFAELLRFSDNLLESEVPERGLLFFNLTRETICSPAFEVFVLNG